MKVLVTGASGFIGVRLSHRLAESGAQVVALYRNPQRLKHLEHANISPIWCDINSRDGLRQAAEGCDQCFHLAALAKHWSPEPSDFERINVQGTENVFTAALESGIRRVVFTSTAGVFAAADPDHPINESSPFSEQPRSEYERSKKACEPVVAEFQSQGLDIVTVYPSRVYGPGVRSTSNVMSDIFRQFLAGKWRFIPGDGKAIGNYVFVEDVVEAHRLVMNDSNHNERYLIGGENLNFNQIVEQLRISTGSSHRLFHVPRSLLLVYATLQLFQARWLGRPPRITPAFVDKYLKNACLDCGKAKSELGYSALSFKDGLEQTLDWIRSHPIDASAHGTSDSN